MARRLQQELGWPSVTMFMKMINKNFIINSKVTTDDINRAVKMFGPPENLIRETMVSPSQVTHRNRTIPLPHQLLMQNKNLRMYIDICYINMIPFLTTRTDITEYITIHALQNRQKIFF